MNILLAGKWYYITRDLQMKPHNEDRRGEKTIILIKKKVINKVKCVKKKEK